MDKKISDLENLDDFTNILVSDENGVLKKSKISLVTVEEINEMFDENE